MIFDWRKKSPEQIHPSPEIIKKQILQRKPGTRTAPFKKMEILVVVTDFFSKTGEPPEQIH